jgi:hypothetical protein
MSNISFEQLVNLVNNRVSPEERKQLLDAIANDPQATADLAWLDHMFNQWNSVEQVPQRQLLNLAHRLVQFTAPAV